MSERKVLNKYYPPDFDPSKIPRAKGSKNRQFTVRLMAPCNMKCYTCGEYIAKGKKFNARKEDVEDMTYIGIRIYRFYIKCPGCLSEISFRTDPASTDYIIEAGAHRNFQALKMAEEQAEREAKEIHDEIESNPMLLLENRTQQSQYEMDLLESLEDLRELNDRHAGVDLAKVANKYQKEKELTVEQRAEAEEMEALQAMGYEMIEGKLVKRLREEDLLDDDFSKKTRTENWNASDHLTAGKSSETFKSQNTLKAKLSGLVRKKKKVVTDEKTMVNSVTTIPSAVNGSGSDSMRMPPPLSRGLTSTSRTGSPGSSKPGWPSPSTAVSPSSSRDESPSSSRDESPSSSRDESPSSSRDESPSSSRDESPSSSRDESPSSSRDESPSSSRDESPSSSRDESPSSSRDESPSSSTAGSSSSSRYGSPSSSTAGSSSSSRDGSPSSSTAGSSSLVKTGSSITRLVFAVATGSTISPNNGTTDSAATSTADPPPATSSEPPTIPTPSASGSTSEQGSSSSSLSLLGAYSDSESDED